MWDSGRTNAGNKINQKIEMETADYTFRMYIKTYTCSNKLSKIFIDYLHTHLTFRLAVHRPSSLDWRGSRLIGALTDLSDNKVLVDHFITPSEVRLSQYVSCSLHTALLIVIDEN